MQKKKSFTLTELLAVIVILSIILAIAIPSINGAITNARRDIFKSNAKLILRTTEFKKASNSSFDPTAINESNIKEELGVSDDNYKTISITKEAETSYIVVIGKDKWEDMVAYGTKQNITVVTEEEFESVYPVITIIGDNPVNINLGVAYEDLGATAIDSQDGDITANIIKTGSVNTNTIGTYYITYSIKNSQNNTITMNREVNVVDGTIPVITLLGDNPVTINTGDTYTDAGATASDNIDGNITDDIVVVSTVNPSEAGSYTVTYNVTDKSGNKATTVTRTVNVIDSTKLANANIHEASAPDGYIEIYTIEDLNNIRTALGESYILMRSLDFTSDNSYANPANKTVYTSDPGWNPISSFTGIFNGNNYTINNLYINRPNTDYIGLFGYTSGAVTISQLGLEGVNVVGKNYTGGLVGNNGGGGTGTQPIVTNCYVTGSVKGVNRVGGLVGNSTGELRYSYANATVEGNDGIGGAIGDIVNSTARVLNTFGAGNIKGASNAGGILGYKDSVASISNCYRSSGATITGTGSPNAYGSSVLPIELKMESFINTVLGWNVEGIWNVSANDYPTLGGTANVIANPVNEITKIEDLYLIRKGLSESYTLMNDLDFADNNSYRNINNKTALTTERGWLPISSFTGVFNGNNHVIKNLYINRPTTDNIGLFGYTSGAVTISQLGLEGVNVVGGSYTGGLVGNNGGGGTGTQPIVTNCYVTGSVKGVNRVGGLVGNSTGELRYSYANATVEGNDSVGGAIGAIVNSTGKTLNTFGAGNIKGASNAGGVAGYKSSVSFVTSCYRSSSAIITGTSTPNSYGTSTAVSDLQTLTPSGLSVWNTDIWQVNVGSFPTFK